MMGIKKSTRLGFTIVEILVVIVVVGILAGIVVVSYNASQRQAQDTRTVAMVNSVNQALGGYKTAKGGFPRAADQSQDGMQIRSCLGSEFKNGNCGSKSLQGDCSAFIEALGDNYYDDYYSGQITPSTYFNQALAGMMSTKIPTIEHAPQTYTEPMTDNCNLVTTMTGPQYTTMCRVGVFDEKIVTWIHGGCGNTSSYTITYHLSSKNADCGVVNAYNATLWYDESALSGTLCAVVRGDVAQCSSATYCPEVWN